MNKDTTKTQEGQKQNLKPLQLGETIDGDQDQVDAHNEKRILANERDPLWDKGQPLWEKFQPLCKEAFDEYWKWLMSLPKEERGWKNFTVENFKSDGKRAWAGTEPTNEIADKITPIAQEHVKKEGITYDLDGIKDEWHTEDKIYHITRWLVEEKFNWYARKEEQRLKSIETKQAETDKKAFCIAFMLDNGCKAPQIMESLNLKKTAYYRLRAQIEDARKRHREKYGLTLYNTRYKVNPDDFDFETRRNYERYGLGEKQQFTLRKTESGFELGLSERKKPPVREIEREEKKNKSTAKIMTDFFNSMKKTLPEPKEQFEYISDYLDYLSKGGEPIEQYRIDRLIKKGRKPIYEMNEIELAAHKALLNKKLTA